MGREWIVNLIEGEGYNFKYQAEKLTYIGKAGSWNQFVKVGETKVWVEVLDTDLHMIEKTQ